MSEIEFGESKRGKPVAFYKNEKYNFVRQYSSSGDKYWRCAKRPCPASITTNNGVLKKELPIHQHCASTWENEKEKFV